MVPRKALDAQARVISGTLYISRGGVGADFELSDVAARIWRLIDGERTLNEVAAIIATENAIDHDIAVADVTEFVADLISDGFVEAS